jgi:hypothetical protein
MLQAGLEREAPREAKRLKLGDIPEMARNLGLTPRQALDPESFLDAG